MKFSPALKFFLLLLCFAGFAAAAAAAAQDVKPVVLPVTTGKAPIIIIPGLTGSDLINSRTGEEVWFRARRAKDDDLRLPISANLARNRDDLVTKDIIRSVEFLKILPEVEIYERLIDSLEKRGGYREAKFDTATKNDAVDTFYVFPYDWRRDNVENARLLIRRIETLKRRIGKPALEFNVIAHSMGGLIARYAAMYGNQDIPAGIPKPNWAGARHFDKIFLLGTPNEGSVLSINGLLNGFSYVGGGLNLPFIQDISRFDLFTIPSIYQLLPHDGSFIAYGEDLKPLKIDIYDPATWEKYGWAVWQDDDFTKKMSAVEQRNARPFFNAALNRAKRFQAALAANGGSKVQVSFYLMGANCKETQNAVLLLRDEKKDRWKTIFKPDSFTRSNGEKVTGDEVKVLLVGMGDGVVTKRSLSGESWIPDLRKMILPISSELYQCENHNKLVTNPEIQDKLFVLLNAVPIS
ncbi:MAG: hypothetical protein H7070_07700 [Saprospiraceae bacterium]|nr:hypothetical protein [Pyrinomonadaceae bacterium]